MSTISMSDVNLSYPNGFQALRDVNLEIAHGEVVGLLGASGSGKSTVLRAVAGLEPIDSGSIVVGGKDMAGIPTHQRNIGMVFQDGQLFAHRSVARNISYGLEMAEVGGSQRDERVREMLDLVGLSGYGDRDVATLSGGQAQRIALARSLAPSPHVLLLDEPLSALDKDLRERLAGDLRDILVQAKMTAIFVTHDRMEADAVADRVCVMDAGRIVREV